MRDLVTEIGADIAIAPAIYAATVNGPAIDLQGFDSAAIIASVGIGGITFDATNRIEMRLHHSDDGVSWADVTNADMRDGKGSLLVTVGAVFRLLTAAHASASVTRVGYIGGKRFVRVGLQFAGTHGTGTAISAVIAKGAPAIRPVG